MEVILLERIEKLGQMGDVVKVKPGFARNYLLPQKKALRATEENKRVFDAQKAQLEAQNLENRKEAESIAAKMDGEKVILIRQAGEAGQLYGSVNARDVAEALAAAGFTVARSQVELSRPIKTLGLHDVIVRLHPEVTVTINANVARTEDEAQVQADTGQAVVGEDAADAAADAMDVAQQAAEAMAAQADEVFEDAAAGEVIADAEDLVQAEADAAEKAKQEALRKVELEEQAQAQAEADAEEGSDAEDAGDAEAAEDAEDK
jgi:large subunit ribosomal protein L9